MITKDDVFDVMEEDLAVADMVLWVGISFEQSASTTYFRRVSLSLSRTEPADRVCPAAMRQAVAASTRVVTNARAMCPSHLIFAWARTALPRRGMQPSFLQVRRIFHGMCRTPQRQSS